MLQTILTTHVATGNTGVCLGNVFLFTRTVHGVVSDSSLADVTSATETGDGAFTSTSTLLSALLFFFFFTFSGVGLGVEVGTGVDSLDDPALDDSAFEDDDWSTSFLS